MVVVVVVEMVVVVVVVEMVVVVVVVVVVEMVVVEMVVVVVVVVVFVEMVVVEMVVVVVFVVEMVVVVGSTKRSVVGGGKRPGGSWGCCRAPRGQATAARSTPAAWHSDPRRRRAARSAVIRCGVAKCGCVARCCEDCGDTSCT